MKYDVVELISQILSDAGMSDIMDQGLNNHSTITLNMKDDINPINIKSEDDEVWVWTDLCEYNLSTLSYQSANLLPLMLNDNGDAFYCGQPCLYIANGNLELRAQIKDKDLQSSGAFMNVLEQYLDLVNTYRTVLI